jgi:hypothetical protein
MPPKKQVIILSEEKYKDALEKLKSKSSLAELIEKKLISSKNPDLLTESGKKIK